MLTWLATSGERFLGFRLATTTDRTFETLLDITIWRRLLWGERPAGSRLMHPLFVQGFHAVTD